MNVEQEVNAIANYWEDHPQPPGEPVTQAAQAEYAEQLADWKSKFGPDGPPEPPPAVNVPGPSAPGAGMQAARLGDSTAHGGMIGPVVTGVASRVTIQNQPAACATDPHVCPMFDGPKPHVGGQILTGSMSVKIGGKRAARVSDVTECKGPPGSIALGAQRVHIGG